MTVPWTPPPDVFETTEVGRFVTRNGCTSFAAMRRRRGALADPDAIAAFVEFAGNRP